MDMKIQEVAELEVACSRAEAGYRELSESELALIGGGQGDVGLA